MDEGNLLLAFGPPAKSYHPEYPFWRLQNDGTFWEIPEREEAMARRGERLRTGDVPPSILRTVDARGGFSGPVFALLRARPDLVAELTADILEEHFEASFHEGILDAVGMPWVPQILISQHLHGGPQVRNTLIRFGGMPLSRPLEPEKVPAPLFIRWHRREVFRDPAWIVE